MKKKTMHDIVLLNLFLDNPENASSKLSLTCNDDIFQTPASQFQKCISKIITKLIIKKIKKNFHRMDSKIYLQTNAFLNSESIFDSAFSPIKMEH